MKKLLTWIKKFWKENKDLIILVFIWILASITILILLCPQIDEMIQAEAIITLVFVTIFYAIQTQKLVKQEKVSLEEEKKKRTADFWHGRLKEFYLPLNSTLVKLHAALKSKPPVSDEVIKNFEEITRVFGKAYLVPREVVDSMVLFMKEADNFKLLKKKEISLKAWVDGVCKKSEELMKKVTIEISKIEYKINEIYGFYIDEKIKKLIEELSTTFMKKR